jgi:hypothetical protein
MGCDINGFLEVKDDSDKWIFYKDFEFLGDRNSPLWCYLWGMNCWKLDEYENMEIEDMPDGVVEYYFIDKSTLSKEGYEMVEDENGVQQLSIHDFDKIDFTKFSTSYDEWEKNPDGKIYLHQEYQDLFNKMRQLSILYKDVRFVFWFDC